jgi:hypothetical protein
VALDNCNGVDDAMAAEEVTGIGSVGNILEGGLSSDNDTRVQGKPMSAMMKMSLLLQKQPLWCSASWHFVTAKKDVHNHILDSTRILKNLLRNHY